MNIAPVNYNFKYNKMNEAPAQEINFKGKGPGKVTEFFANTYGKYILNSEQVRNFCKGCTKLDKKDASRHFQVFGSAVTSFAYMHSTMKNKDIEKKNARTLATNQFLGFAVPAIASYTADAGMKNFNKYLEYCYSAAKEKEIALGKLDKATKEEAVKNLGKGLKGFRCMMGIITFTTIYRFITPVAITPVANKFGNWINEKIDNKEAQKKQLNTAA